MSHLPPPGPLRRTCALPTCDENCSYCRENDRIAEARRGMPFLAPDNAAEPAPEPAAAAPEPAAAAPEPAPVHGIEAARAAVAAGTIAQGSSQWWAHVLGTTNAPTQEQFDAMTPEEQAPWTCIICGWGAALADSPQPGRVCSYECMYEKYR